MHSSKTLEHKGMFGHAQSYDFSPRFHISNRSGKSKGMLCLVTNFWL